MMQRLRSSLSNQFRSDSNAAVDGPSNKTTNNGTTE